MKSGWRQPPTAGGALAFVAGPPLCAFATQLRIVAADGYPPASHLRILVASPAPLSQSIAGLEHLHYTSRQRDPGLFTVHRIGNMKYGAGLGFRYLSPVGPVRIDVARPFNRRWYDDSWQYFITLGYAF